MTEVFTSYVKNYCLKNTAKEHKHATGRLTTAMRRTSNSQERGSLSRYLLSFGIPNIIVTFLL